MGLEVFGWTFRRENRFLPLDFRRGDDPAAPGDLAGEIATFLAAGLDSVITDHPDLARVRPGRRARRSLSARGRSPPQRVVTGSASQWCRPMGTTVGVPRDRVVDDERLEAEDPCDELGGHDLATARPAAATAPSTIAIRWSA